jgi:hypothetical protein
MKKIFKNIIYKTYLSVPELLGTSLREYFFKSFFRTVLVHRDIQKKSKESLSFIYSNEIFKISH